jgi:predicted Rossmann fold flavoprotein
MYNESMKIAIIGAGASGMAAALQAAWRGASVTLFERNAVVGRKLLVTGAGRCNIANDGAAGEKYACADPQWMRTLLAAFGVLELRGMLREVGILVYKTPDGWYYPLSESAHTVVDSFAAALRLAKVNLRLSSQVTGVTVGENGYVIKVVEGAKADPLVFDKVIMAAGGKAYPTLGSRGELFPLLKLLGHTLRPLHPALAPVLADLKSWKALQGVRLDAGVTLCDGDQRLASAAGNLIFADWGLNGPAVMDISHHISEHPIKNQTLALNLLHFHQKAFNELLQQKRHAALPIQVFLGAFFPPKVASFYPAQQRIPGDTPLNQIEDGALQRLERGLQDSRFQVKGVREYEYCQLTAGGVPATEVDPRTMESRIRAGLYLTGETLDVVGPCGGYNLQFAFSSGALAGIAAARK